MSDGTLRALGILVALFQGGTEKRPSLVAIEEPEVALHPSAAAVLREALTVSAKRSQILITSHSPDLLDDRAIHADSLIAVTADGGVTQIAALDGASRKVLRQGLYTPGELLKLNQLAPDPAAIADTERKQFELFEIEE